MKTRDHKLWCNGTIIENGRNGRNGQIDLTNKKGTKATKATKARELKAEKNLSGLKGTVNSTTEGVATDHNMRDIEVADGELKDRKGA